ncbi:tail fiber assembly protein [Citrobacter cronae]
MATAEEISMLSEWKKYRVKVMRIDTSKPEWPLLPDIKAS